MEGMAMVINEAPDKHEPPPKGFPICQNFHDKDELNMEYIKKGEL